MVKYASVLAAVAVATCCQAATIYSWENVSHGMVYDGTDGHYTNNADVSSFSTIGATNGTYSVQIANDTTTGWHQLTKNFDGALRTELQNGGPVSIDVTVVQTNPGTIEWNQFNFAYNTDGGWVQLAAAQDIGTAILDTPVTKTLNFTFPAVPDTITFYGLHMIWNSGFNAGGTPGATADIYVDNMVIGAVPEPTSLALLGLAALPLLGRKRSHR